MSRCVAHRRNGDRVVGDRGSVSLFLMACLSLLLVVGAALGVVAAMVVAHRQAQSAADLAALAAAGAVGRGQDGCAAAVAVAAANAAALTSCRAEGRVVELVVEVSGPRWLGQVGDLAARARAGPASRRLLP